MMKANYFKTLILFLFASSIAIAGNVDNPERFKGRHTKEKKIKKEFNVNADALLRINNSYGNVNVTSWNENRVVIEVLVRTNGNDEEKVIQKLEAIDVEFDASSGIVAARTKFEKNKKSWWNSWSKNDKVSMEINYTIKVPVTNSVDLENDYGGIFLNKIEGTAKISCDYGKIEIGELMADENYLNFDYTDNSTIGYMKSGRINADYSGFTLERSDYVELNADYSKSIFEDVKDLNYNCDYGNLMIEKAGKVTGRSDYLTLKMGKISGDVSLNADYGSIKIDELTAQTGNVTIQSDYTGIKIGYANDFNFTFDLNLSYGSLKGEDEFNITKSRTESSSKYYSGHYGSSSAKSNININSDYGGIVFTKVN